MPEEIRVKISAQYDGAGAKEAIRDEQKIREEAAKPSPSGARDGKAGPQPEPAKPVSEELKVRREAHAEELRAAELRAGGHTKEADALERSAAIRTRAMHIEKNLQYSRKEAVELATREVNAISHGGHGAGGMGNARMIGEALDMATGQQGWVNRMTILSRLPHMIGSLVSNPAVLAGAAVVGGVAAYGGYQYKKFEEGQKDEAFGNSQFEEHLKFGRKLKRGRMLGAGSGEYFAQELDLKEQVAEAEAHKAELERQRDDSMLGIADRFLGTSMAKGIFGFKSEGQRKIEEADADAQRKRGEADQAEAEKKKRWAEIGSKELKAQELRLNYDPRGARELEHQVEWTKERDRLRHEGADEWDAQEGAGMKVAESVRAENAKWGRIVNARSGAADVARAAALATGEIQGRSSTHDAINKLHDTVKEQHRETIGAATTKNWSRGKG